MASDISVVNSALHKLGVSRIVAFTDTTKQGTLDNDTFADIRDSLLRAHPWNFAIDRAALAADATAPEWGFDARYALPEGATPCLRVLEVEGGDENSGRWTVEGRFIITSLTAPINIRYIKRITDANSMDAMFREALSARLSMEWATTLTHDAQIQNDMTRLYNSLKLPEARSIDGQEDIAVQIEACEWIESRF